MAMQRRRFGRLGITDGAERYYQDNQTIDGLPVVDDPEKTYANMTRQEYMDFVKDYGEFEKQLIQDVQSDTSLVDQAREDTAVAAGLSSGLAQRNLSRYGTQLTPAQQREMQRGLQRNTTLGSIQAMADARIAQRETNQRVLTDLINIGQGVNRSSLSQMQGAAGDASARKQAYENAKAQSKAQTYSTVGSLASMAILAFAI